MEKILVIEDAHLLRNDILETLGLEGYQVFGAEDGMEGIEMAREHNPDLIICDIMMPELDGYGVLDELRKDAHMELIPFIFMTAKTDKTDVRLGMGLGADDYLTKPFLTADLLKTIKVRLHKRQIEKEITEAKLKDLRDSISTALPHELRTPLNTVLGFSEMLVSEHERLEPEQVKNWAGHINLAALRLYRLIENYLIFVRIEMVARDPDKVEAQKQDSTTNPATTIQHYALQKAQELGRDSDLSMQVEDVESLRIAEQNLGKIVEELVDNAFKFSVKGKTVEVHAAKDDDEYVLRVIDQGRGMSPEQINGMGPYIQFDRWLYEQQGMGLGLAIADRLAFLAGTKLDMDSTPEQGSTAIIRFSLD
jgi:two-component system, sensor histidine kinase and response regulator